MLIKTPCSKMAIKKKKKKQLRMPRTMKKLMAVFAATLMALAIAAPAMAQESARIHLIHGIPETPVDVLVDGAPVFEDFNFGDTQDLSALAGETLVNLQVVLAGTDTVAIDAGDVTLPASGNFTIIAHLTADGTPTLAVFENDVSSIAAGNGRLTVRHTAAAPAVDVKADGAVAFSNLANPNEAAADLPAATYSVEVVPTGADDPVVIGPADIAVEDGNSLIVYAVGSLDGGTLQVLTESITGLGETPAEVPSGNSPVDAGFPVAASAAIALIAALGVSGGLVLARRSN